MGAQETAAATITIPAWLWGAVGVLGTVILTWMLGLFGRLLGGSKTASGGGTDACANCAQISTVTTAIETIRTDLGSLRTGLDALNGRIDRILELRAGGLK